MIVPIEAGEITMAMTTAERVRAVRERRRRREIQLTVVLHQRTWGRSPAALRGAASTDPKLRAEAVSIFISDTLWG